VTDTAERQSILAATSVSSTPGMENAWRWLSVDEARATLNEDPNWTTDEVEQ
jgi:hypothetical protein